MRLLSLFVLVLTLGSCRSTMTRTVTPAVQEPRDVPEIRTAPVGVGESFTCVIDKRGQGTCLDLQKKTWKTLRAANSTPTLRNLVVRSTVACAIGVKPASLENRILCWQPQNESDASLLSAKINSRLRTLTLQKDRVCTLLGDGQVACALLGSDRNLKLANVKNLRTMRDVESGEGFTCGLKDGGVLFCWGDNASGQLGLGSRLVAENEPVAIAGFSGAATSFAVGSRHVCAVNDSGEVFCWGSNSDQQLGTDGADSPIPQTVRGLPVKAETLALGAKHSCAQLVDGSVWCWGAAGRLGADTPGGLIPVRVHLPVTSAQIVASLDRTCSLLTTGEIFCWGNEPEVLAVPL